MYRKPRMMSYDQSMRAKSQNPTPCPVERAIQIIGGKWKLLLLRSLLLDGPQRYNELLRAIGGISPKELTRNLRELSFSALITRNPTTQQYALTDLGHGLMPTFKSLLTWGQKLLPGPVTNIPVR